MPSTPIKSILSIENKNKIGLEKAKKKKRKEMTVEEKDLEKRKFFFEHNYPFKKGKVSFFSTNHPIAKKKKLVSYSLNVKTNKANINFFKRFFYKSKLSTKNNMTMYNYFPSSFFLRLFSLFLINFYIIINFFFLQL